MTAFSSFALNVFLRTLRMVVCCCRLKTKQRPSRSSLSCVLVFGGGFGQSPPVPLADPAVVLPWPPSQLPLADVASVWPSPFPASVEFLATCWEGLPWAPPGLPLSLASAEILVVPPVSGAGFVAWLVPPRFAEEVRPSLLTSWQVL